jgi:hypothetical protein
MQGGNTMSRPKTDIADYKGLMLRLPTTYLEACKRQAKKQHRSLNGQLIDVIEHWLRELQEIPDHELVGSRDY